MQSGVRKGENEMSAYAIRYKMHYADEPKLICVASKNKVEAWSQAVFHDIPLAEGMESPYSAWVTSVTYNNGNCKRFNTFEGKPY